VIVRPSRDQASATTHVYAAEAPLTREAAAALERLRRR